MLRQSIKKYLEDHHISYESIPHAAAYSSAQIAQAAHIPGHKLAKVVMVKLDGKLTMVALPAHAHLDLHRLKIQSGAKQIQLASELEFSHEITDCDPGAMPPFGEHYHMDVWMAESLQHQDWVACNAGTHTDLLKIKAADLLKLIHPKSLPAC